MVTPGSQQHFRQTLAAARKSHQAGAGAVLDILMRTVAQDAWPDFEHWLATESGVSVVSSPDRVSRLPHAAALLPSLRSAQAGLVRLDDASSPCLVMADPWADGAVQQIAIQLGAMPLLAAATAAVIEKAFGDTAAAPSTAVSPPASGSGVASVASGSIGDLARAPSVVVDFVDAAVRAAYADGASDVHFECDRQGVTVKLRLDGVMTRFARLEDPRRAEEVISRIKVMSQLDITERRIPQDGRIRFSLGPTAVDLRVSIMPCVFGEDAVLRLLDKAQLRAQHEGISLDSLGFDALSSGTLRELAQLPHGMLLVTGPTGSGKTTTVYAVLTEVNRGIEKIITIEDPVEYELPGVLQIPVNDRKGLTFAKGLRSILRHDPDRILVGEIRDAETAEIAVQSALTGHQVFTTVHANSVFDVIGRFRHFGLDMFGFMSSLNGIVVQRLVRALCPACRGTRQASSRELQWLNGSGQSQASTVAVARGCDQCRGSGYRGRTAIAEVHTVDDGLRDAVTSGAALTQLRKQVQASGGGTLLDRAAQMVADGRTTVEEIRRVVGWR